MYPSYEPHNGAIICLAARPKITKVLGKIKTRSDLHFSILINTIPCINDTKIVVITKDTCVQALNLQYSYRVVKTSDEEFFIHVHFQIHPSFPGIIKLLCYLAIRTPILDTPETYY